MLEILVTILTVGLFCLFGAFTSGVFFKKEKIINILWKLNRMD
jgi:hypothetical protein